MTPTFNPSGAFFNDLVLIGSFENTEKLVGQVVFVQRNERKVVKRLTQIDSASQTCWLESDANIDHPERKGQYYDSNIFGFVPCDCIIGIFSNF